MANKKITYEIVLDVKNGVVQTKNLEKQFDTLKQKIKDADSQAKVFGKSMGQAANKTGLAGAAVVEIGRAISDSNYGMMAMANNLQQIATLMITLIATSGGLVGGLKALWGAFMGPLGLIVVFQSFIAYLEKSDRAAQSAARAGNAVAEAYKNAATELELMLKLDNDLTNQERENIETRIHNLKEEAKIRAQIAEIQRLQGEIIKLNTQDAEEFVSVWEKIWDDIQSGAFFRGRRLPGATGRTESSTARLLGLGEANRAELIKELQEKIGSIIKDINVDELKRVVDDNDPGSKKRKEISKLFLFPEALANAGFAQDPFSLLENYQMHKEAELEITKRMNDQIVAAEQLAAENRIKTLQAIGNAMIDLGYVIGEQTALGKGIAVAGALIDTYAAAAGILKAHSGVPIPGYAIAQAVAAVAFGLAQVKQILSVKVPNKGGGGGSTAGTNAAQVTPQFNIIGSTGPNRIGEAVREAMGDRPLRAYVTTKDIKSGQELDRNTRSGASI